MSPSTYVKMYKSRKQLNLERRRKRNSERGKYGNEVKREKMRERSAPLEVAGTITTTGSFGDHFIEVLACDNPNHVWMRVDGELRRPRTVRGVYKILSEWIARKS